MSKTQEQGSPSPEEMGLKSGQAEAQDASMTSQQELVAQLRQQAIEEAQRQGWTLEDLSRKYDLAFLPSEKWTGARVEGVIDGQHVELSRSRGGSAIGSLGGKQLTDAEAERLFMKYSPVARLQGKYLENKAALSIIRDHKKDIKEAALTPEERRDYRLLDIKSRLREKLSEVRLEDLERVLRQALDEIGAEISPGAK